MKKIKNKFVDELIQIVVKKDYPVKDTDMSTICIYNGGACIISMSGRECKHFDIPDGIFTHGEWILRGKRSERPREMVQAAAKNGPR